MSVNWFGYYNSNDGYGRFNARLAEALDSLTHLEPYHIGVLDMPDWMLWKQHIEWSNLNITCAPPYMVKKIPGRRHWLFSMTEGSRIPLSWVEQIAKSGVERVIVPCAHNALAFKESGVSVPIHVVPGGTDPEEFPVIETGKRSLEDYRPYTFLTFADRGFRKGWDETRNAFYHAFGGKTTGNMQVRLIIKGRKSDNSLIGFIAKGKELDARVEYLIDDLEDMRSLYERVDCLVLPSRSEGWGMLHREAACSGLPVITQAYAGLDDGYTKEWAMVVEGDYEEEIPKEVATALGKWRIANFQDIAQKMKYCFYSPETAASFGRNASAWLRQNQTWQHSAKELLTLEHMATWERAR